MEPARGPCSWVYEETLVLSEILTIIRDYKLSNLIVMECFAT